MTQALSYSEIPFDLEHQLITKTRDLLSKKDPASLEELSQSNLELLNEAMKNDEEKQYPLALQNLLAIKSPPGEVLFLIASLYFSHFSNYQKAEEFYIRAIENGYTEAMFDLAVLYTVYIQDDQRGEKFLLKAAKQRNTNAMTCIAMLYFLKNKKKKESLKFIKNACKEGKDPVSQIAYSNILLWNGQIAEGQKYLQEALSQPEVFDELLSQASFFLLFFLAKEQYHFCQQLFADPELQLKEKLRPVYYVLVHYLPEEFPNEEKKSGEELQETIKEMIQTVEAMRKNYG